KLKEPLVLLEQRVFRLGQNLHQRRFVQVVHDARNGQAADKFRYQTVANQIPGLDLFEQLRVATLCSRWRRVGVKAESPRARALFNDFFQANESSAADKQNIGRIHGRKFLVRMLAAALRRNVGDRAFQNLQQSLLDTFARNIASDRRVLVFLGDLVDFVDVDDALLRLLHVAIGGLQQFQNNIFNVLAYVTRFRQGGRINDGEGYVQHARKSLRQECLAGAGWADQQNVGLAQLDVARLLVQKNPFVMVID